MQADIITDERCSVTVADIDQLAIVDDTRYGITVIDDTGNPATLADADQYGLTIIDPSQGLPEVTDSIAYTAITADEQATVVKLAGVLDIGAAAATPDIILITATEALGGHRVATVQGWYADSGNVSHAAAIAGITLQAVAAGSTVQVQRSGEIEEASWAWVLGQAVYLGASGQLTQTPPVSGIVVVIGVPVSATRLAIDIQPPIHMA